MKLSITPVAGVFLLLSFALVFQAAPEMAEAGEQPVRSLEASESRLDSNYWVLIRDVTIPGRSGKILHKGLDVLVTEDSLPFKRIDQSRLNNYRYSQ